ncbi:hypothetical protein KC887_02575 [Candidatus Kaiserbacteria bacterium]|nr:hypothetical protein [Candidatus Kaiserbacteria bacterium]
MEIYKNWSEICKLRNPWLKMLICTADDDSTLTRLRAGWPELFTSEKVDIVAPFSALAQEMLATEAQLWGDTLTKYNIPYFGWHGGVDAISEHVPEEYHEAIKDLTEEGDGLYVLSNPKEVGYRPVYFKDEECVVMEAWTDGQGYPDSLIIVPKRFLDFLS